MHANAIKSRDFFVFWGCHDAIHHSSIFFIQDAVPMMKMVLVTCQYIFTTVLLSYANFFIYCRLRVHACFWVTWLLTWPVKHISHCHTAVWRILCAIGFSSYLSCRIAYEIMRYCPIVKGKYLFYYECSWFTVFNYIKSSQLMHIHTKCFWNQAEHIIFFNAKYFRCIVAFSKKMSSKASASFV